MCEPNAAERVTVDVSIKSETAKSWCGGQGVSDLFHFATQKGTGRVSANHATSSARRHWHGSFILSVKVPALAARDRHVSDDLR
jgi:hypothetical protein